MRSEKEIRERQMDQDLYTLFESHNPLDRLTGEIIMQTLRWVLNEDICVACGRVKENGH
jgi:hypothetical protein